MPKKSRNEINQPPSGESKKSGARAGESNKLNKRGEVLKAGSVELKLDTSEGRGPAFWQANRLRETLNWPLGY